MSTRGARRRERGRIRYRRGLAAVVAALAVIGGAAATVSVVQGPRATAIQQDPSGAISASGSRIIFTANEPLAVIDPTQVTVTPATDFTVDVSGRTVGIRFPTALHADTKYTVAIDDVAGAGGGPKSTFETSFLTPKAEVLTLERDANADDRIVAHTLGDDGAKVILEASQIDDFRVTSGYIVATLVDDDGAMHVIVTSRDTGERHEIPLPGAGTVTGLQVSERGQLYGFAFTDAHAASGQGRINVLFTGSLASADPPSSVITGGEEPSVDRWRFVPETSSLLLNSFEGDLTLVDRDSADGEVSSFGTALSIEGVARSTYTALIDRLEDGIVELDLATGQSRPVDNLELSDDTVLAHILPLPGGTLRSYAQLVDGIPTTSRIMRTGSGGEMHEVAHTDRGEILQQMCASPSGQYVALTISDSSGAPFDGGVQPLPELIETRIYDAESGEEKAVWPGFDASWCEVGPW